MHNLKSGDLGVDRYGHRSGSHAVRIFIMRKVFGIIKRGWLSFADALGVVMFFVITTVIYFTLVTVVAIPHRLLADPLSLRRRARSTNWWERAESDSDISTFWKQS